MKKILVPSKTPNQIVQSKNHPTLNSEKNTDLLKKIEAKWKQITLDINIPRDKNASIYKNKIVNSINLLYNWFLELNEIKSESQIVIKKINSIKKKVLPDLNKRIKYVEQMTVSKSNELSNFTKGFIVKVTGVSKYYSSSKMAIKILDNLNFEINYGDFAVILGPSGSGKTTLMNLLSGMDKPTIGKVWVNGYHLDEMNEKNLTVFRKNNIGYVFQRYGLLPNLTVYENVLMGSYLGKNKHTFSENRFYKRTSYSKEQFKKMNQKEKEITHLNRKEEEHKVDLILKDLELLELKEKYPYELSGGQKQRTSIARTIAKNPKIIFGDEPTAAVDSEMSKSIIDSFAKINRDLKTTVVIITHDENIANYANKIFYILDGKISKVISKSKNEKSS